MTNERTMLSIDNQMIEFTDGQTILQVAQDNGIYIPTLCFIEGLPPYGGCRLCIVKVKGLKGYPPACSTPANKDMVVITCDEELQDLRREVLKLILSEHPHSCLICDSRHQCEESRLSSIKSGRKFGCFSCSNKENCELRQLFDYLEIRELPYELTYKNYPLLREDPFIDQDHNLCILCGKCVRVCTELRGYGALDFINRGSETKVSAAYGLLHLDDNCQFCGGCIDICPTGTFTSKNTKWVKKAGNDTISICGFCSVGCGFHYYSISDKLMESIPDKRNLINKGQACIIGRFCTSSFINGKNRLKDPLIKRNNELIPCEWDVTYSQIIENLKKYESNEIAVLISHDLSNESAYILNKFSKQILKTDNIFTRSNGNMVETYYNLVKLHSNGIIPPRSFQNITKSNWVLLINSNVEISHPILQIYLKQAKDRGAKIISLNSKDVEPSITMRRLLDYELYLSIEESIGFITLMVKSFVSQRGIPPKSVKNFEQLNAALKQIKIPKELLKYQDLIAEIVEMDNGTILFDQEVELPQKDTMNLVGLLIDLIILSKSKIDLIPLWQHGNADGVMLSIFQDLKSADHIFKEIKKGKIKALYLTERIEDSDLLKNLEFVIVQDIYPSNNFQLANVVLPTCTFIEDSGSLINAELKLQEFKKAASPFGKSKPDWEIICELAKKFDESKSSEFQFVNQNEILSEMKSTNPHLISSNDTKFDSSRDITLYIPLAKDKDLKSSNPPFSLETFQYRGEKIINQVDDLQELIKYKKLKKSGMLIPQEKKVQQEGFKVLKNIEIVPNIFELIIEAPLIAKKARPGNFILIMQNEESERVPMTLSNWDPIKGTITIYYEERGYSTKELTRLLKEDYLYSVVGPLGNEIKLEKFGTILLGGGCYGIGAIYPIAKEANAKGNTVIVILEARNKTLFYLQKEFEEIADKMIYCTSDGSKGIKGKIEEGIEQILNENVQIDRCFFIGCKYMMQNASNYTKEHGNIPTFVSLSTIMIDGTGMCGGCRLSLIQDGKEIVKFACVDGPSFDAHLVNWEELVRRDVQFEAPEVFIYQNHLCKLLQKYKSENP